MAARSFLYGGASGGGGGGGVSGGSVLNSVLLTNKRVACSSSSSKPLDSFFISGPSPPFLGSQSMFSFEDGGNGSGRPFFQSFDQEDNGDDEYDDYFRQPEKKRRLKAEQVQFLEKSFETENKLEPERKIQLAKDLGLQPRQIAIWFQNRRARWKTKQLEKDYDLLQDSYNKLKADYENLVKEQKKLKSEVHDLSDRLLLQEKEKVTSDSSSTKSLSETVVQQEQVVDCAYEEDVSKSTDLDNIAVRSGVFDSESPHYAEGVYSSIMERGDSSYVFEQDQRSDGSLDEEDNLRKIFLHRFPKAETSDYPEQPAVSSCYFGLPGDDQSFGFWPY